MLVYEHPRRGEDFLRWVLAMAAVAFVLLASRSAAAQEDGAFLPPRFLSAQMFETATPMSGMRTIAPDDMAPLVWQVLSDHSEGRAASAIAGWQAVNLPESVAIWKHIALGAAYLEVVDTPRASDALNSATSIDAVNPLLNYFTGILRMQESFEMSDWPERDQSRVMNWVSHVPLPTPTSRSLCQLTAIMELEQAVAGAASLAWDQPLVDSSYLAAVPTPTVGDLVQALGAEHFERNAHHMLGGLYLTRGNAELAEEHLDAAHGLGCFIVFGYRELGDYYAAQSCYGDAARAYAKAMSRGSGIALPGQKMFRNLGKAIADY